MRGARADGETIRRLRKSKGLTQEDLAAAAVCDVKTVRNAERANNLDLFTLEKIASVLVVPISDIVHGLGDDESELQTRVDVVQQFWTAFNERNLDAMMALCHDDVVMRLPGAPEIPFAGEYRGKVEVRSMNEIAFETADTEPITTKNVSFFVCDDRVFVQGAAELKSKTNGSIARLSMTHVFRLEGLKIIDMEGGYDSLAMNKVLKAPPAACEPLDPPTEPGSVTPEP